MIIEHNNKKFYVDNKLYKDLEIYCEHMLKNNEDIVILLDGKEGSGKSTFTRQISLVISYILLKNHNIKYDPNINCLKWTLKGYTNHSLTGTKYQCNILDESRRLLNRKAYANKETREFSDYMSECRKYNQVHFILLPAFHDIDKYIILWRAKMLLHCVKYINEDGELIKGEFKNIPIDERLLYMWEENRYRYPKFHPKKFGGYQGKFSDVEAFNDMDKYEDMQKKYSYDKYGVDNKPTREEELLLRAYDIVGVTQTSKIFDCAIKTIYNKLKKIKDKTLNNV